MPPLDFCEFLLFGEKHKVVSTLQSLFFGANGTCAHCRTSGREGGHSTNQGNHFLVDNIYFNLDVNAAFLPRH